MNIEKLIALILLDQVIHVDDIHDLDVNRPSPLTKYKALHTAIFNHCHKSFASLMEIGGDILDLESVAGTGKSTPLHVAAYSNNIEATRRLVNAGATIDSRDHWRKTPLHHASFHGNVQIVDILMRNGASIFARDKKGFTPLHKCSDQTRACMRTIYESMQSTTSPKEDSRE